MMALQKTRQDSGNLIGCIQRCKVIGVDDVYFRLRCVTQVRDRSGDRKELVTPAPNDENGNLELPQQGLPLRVERDVGAVVKPEVVSRLQDALALR